MIDMNMVLFLAQWLSSVVGVLFDTGCKLDIRRNASARGTCVSFSLILRNQQTVKYDFERWCRRLDYHEIRPVRKAGGRGQEHFGH